MMKLKDLSGILGLSPTTVSRALNGYPDVSETTRRRVKAAAQAHDYRPDTRARQLATGRAMTVGHIIPVSTKHELVNPIFTDFIAGAGEAYSAAGFDLKLTLIADGDADGLYRDIARRGTVDGLIVHGPRISDPRIPQLSALQIPFVVHGRSSTAVGDYNWIDVNNRQAFFDAVQHLISLGHERIGLVNGIESMDFAMRRRDGYEAALKSRNIAIRPDLIVHGEMTERHGHASAAKMLLLSEPPTAFLVSSVISAIGVRRAITGSGRRVGTDVSVMIFDDDLSYFRNESEKPVYTAMRSSVHNAGYQAGQMILDIISGKSDAPVQRLLKAEFVPGQSTAPAPSADPNH